MKRILTGIRDAVLTIARGDILIKMGVHRYLPHIAFAFAVCVLSIALSYYADRTARDREDTRRELEDARLKYSSKYIELVSLYRYTTVEDMLESAGSDLEPLREPVTTMTVKK